MEKYFLGIDNGGTVTKVAIYNEKGEELSHAQRSADIIVPQKGFVERDIDELLDSVIACIREVLSKSNIAGDQIAAVSVSCHGKGLYLLDKQGRPAYNGIMSSDSRASSIVAEAKSNGIAEKIYPITYQQLWTGHPASLLMWLQSHNPAVLEKTRHIFMGHDYIRHYLTGEASAEISNISGSALVDVEKKEYSNEVLGILGLSSIKDKLPPIIESTDKSGSIRKQIADDTGLKMGTPVYAGFFDVVAASISSGLVDSTEINATMGTWAIATAVSESIVKKDYPYIWGNYCIKDRYFVHEGSPTSASNLEWYVQNILGKEEGVYDRCNEMVQKARFDDTLLFFPFLYSSNIKDGMPASLVGLNSHHSSQDILRAIYEGILFAHKTHLDKLLHLFNTIGSISVVGGPANSDVWMQMFADMSQKEIRLPNCKEAGCKGVVIAAMVAEGIFANFREAVSETVKIVKTFNPSSEHKLFYEEKYNKYHAVAKALSQYPL